MNKLSSDTARLISSLQVITKVENVVKELVENALDADASCVEVKFEDYGLTKIEVRDNGSGINHTDIEFVAQRHYTSKISCKEDLDNLQSYGFRGEALSSLCDVADVFVTTRTKNDAFSTKYSFNHKGIIVATKPCHLVQGTTIVANNLFAKTPIRCQFYQTPAKKKQILKGSEDVLMAFALIHPEKRFSFIHNKSVVWQKPGCKDLKSTLENVLGANIMSNMVKVCHKNEGLQIDLCAFIPTSPGTRYHRKTSDRCFLYVNKRPIRDKEIEKVIKQHTSKGSNPSNSLRYPVAFLSIELTSDKVDSNIEPDKSRVEICGKEALLTTIDQVLYDAYFALPEGDLETEKENRSDGSFNTDLGENEVMTAVIEPDNYAIRKPEKSSDVPWSSATQWSKGHAVVNDDDIPVQPVRILTGHHQRPASENVLISAETGGKRPSRQQDPGFTPRSSNSPHPLSQTPASCAPKNVIQVERLRQSRLNSSGILNSTPTRLRVPNRTLNPSSVIRTATKRKASSPLSEDIRNAFAMRNLASRGNVLEPPVLTEGKNAESEVAYAEGQESHLKFDFEKIRENLSHKEGHVCAKSTSSYVAVGVLDGIKGGIVLDNMNRKLHLVNLLRLQETKLFWSLMENHSLHTKELCRPIVILFSMLTAEEKSGLEKMSRSTPSMAHLDVELTDDRIRKNGFKVKLVNGLDGVESLLVYEMANAISYYNTEDLKWILRKTGSSARDSITDSRPFKMIQFLQAEAVRMSYSTPVHSTILENLDGLTRHFSNNFANWKCFHEKTIFHSVLNFKQSDALC